MLLTRRYWPREMATKPAVSKLQIRRQAVRGRLGIRKKSYACDVKSRQLLSRSVRDSETRCSLDNSQPGRAWLVTAGFGALGTMQPFAREQNTVRWAQLLPASGGVFSR
jgi:hypothetical protein